jgi:hypothetical protein
MVSAKLTYAEMNVELSPRSEDELISLLDSLSIKVGDTAAAILSRKGALDAVYDAVCDGRLKRALGRKRALYLLIHAGPRYRKGLDACIRLLRDRSKLVVDEALFGLCHWNDQSTLAALDTVTCRAVTKDVELARRAIKARDIRIFSRHYSIHEKWSEHQSFAG